MVVPIAFVLAFIAVVMAFQGGASVVFAQRDRTRRVNRRLTLLEQGLSPDEVYATLVRKPAAGRGQEFVPAYDRILLFCRQAGLTMSPVRLGATVAGAALLLWVTGLVLLAVTGKADFSSALLQLFGAAVLTSLGTLVWVNMRRNARLKKIEEQMPIALDIVTRGIRAGHPVVSAVQLAAQEMSDPVGTEFGLIVDETTYGLDFKEALVNLARRTGSPDAYYFAVSVGIQSETGGNLAEILANLSEVIRGRLSLRLKVKALASEGRMSAIVLSVLPIIVIGWLLFTNPKFYSSKADDPIFWPAVCVLVLLYLIGQLLINRIVNFRY